MWNVICGKIFSECVEKFRAENIRYFVLRNYELLPQSNASKDVDIVIEPGKIKRSIEIVQEAYAHGNMTNFYHVVFEKLHCLHGMDSDHHNRIHIDLMEGYRAKGYEIFSFDEMYEHTTWQKNFCVIDKYFEGVMLLIYKQFGYKRPKLKEAYQKKIKETYDLFPDKLEEQIAQVTSVKLSKEIMEAVEKEDFVTVLAKSDVFTRQLRRYVLKKHPLVTIGRILHYFCQKIWRIIFTYRAHARVFAVIAPDGAGKTTFIEMLTEKLDFYYANLPQDERIHLYHFRPGVFPNLGELGEKAKVMQQDDNWTNPHRGKPANFLSSMIRISYYTMDYIIGWMKCVRKDVQYDRTVVFDRYSYDLIVDPLRTKLNLPKGFRKFFVSLTPQPKVVFVLDTTADIIYKRKQELAKEEISRQLEEYRKLALSHRRFHIINAGRTPDEMSDEAVKIFLNEYTRKVEKHE